MVILENAKMKQMNQAKKKFQVKSLKLKLEDFFKKALKIPTLSGNSIIPSSKSQVNKKLKSNNTASFLHKRNL